MHYSYPVHSQPLGILLKYYPIIQGPSWALNLQPPAPLCHTGIPPPPAPPPVPARALQQRDKGSVPPGSVAQVWWRAVRHEPWKGEVCPFSTGQETPPRSGFSFAASPPEVRDLFNAAFFTVCLNDGTDRNVIPKRRKGEKKKKKSPMTASPLPS